MMPLGTIEAAMAAAAIFVPIVQAFQFFHALGFG